MTTSSKQTTSYVLAAVGLAAGIGGIFYASKKGYGGWGKFGMFILFGAPFNIASTALQMSVKAEEKDYQNKMINNVAVNPYPSDEEIIAAMNDGTFCTKYPQAEECAPRPTFI